MKKKEIAGSPLKYPVNFQDLKSGIVKLEFGNLEHIRAIDQEKERLDNQGTYRVTFAVSGEVVIDVEADDEDDAEEKAREEISFGIGPDDLDLDYDLLEVEKVEGID